MGDRLDEIRRRWIGDDYHYISDACILIHGLDDVEWLLNEVDRLRETLDGAAARADAAECALVLARQPRRTE